MGKTNKSLTASPSVDPMMMILSEKKKKKKELQKQMIQKDSEIQDKKKKNKHKEVVNIQMTAEKPKKKKNADKESKSEEGEKLEKKKKTKNKLNRSQESLNGDISSESKGKKNKKRSSDSDLRSPSKKVKDAEPIEDEEPDEDEAEAEEEADLDVDEPVDEEAKEELKDNGWSQEENLAMLSKMEEQLPKTDDFGFRRRLAMKKWDWAKVCIDNKTPEECKEQFDILLQPTVKMKNLRQIIENAKACILNPYKRSAYHQFVFEFSKNLKNKDLPQIEVLRMASKAWKESDKPAKVSTPEVRLPFEIYADEVYANQTEKPDKAEIRQKFETLKKKTRSKYIMMSAKDIYEYRMNVKDKEDRVKVSKKQPKKAELDILFESLKMPVPPPKKSVIVYYYELQEQGKLDDVSAKEKLLTATRYYNQLPKEEKDRRIKLLTQQLEEYNQEFTPWLERQEEYVQYWVDQTTKKPATKTKSSSDKKTVFTNSVTTNMSCPKFNNEPKMPPRTGYKLFCAKFDQKMKGRFQSQVEKRKTCQEYWENLSLEHKTQYKQRVSELLNEYLTELSNFVGDLPESERKLYIGFNRRSYFNLLGRDIFEEEYPNVQYPEYVSSPSKNVSDEQKKTKTTKQKGKASEKASSEPTHQEVEENHPKKMKVPINIMPVSSESSDEDSDDNAVFTSATKKPPSKLTRKEKKSSSDSESSDSDSEDHVTVNSKRSPQKIEKRDSIGSTIFKKTNVAKVTKMSLSDSSDSESDSDSSEEIIERNKVRTTPMQKKVVANANDDSDESDEDSDDIDIEPSFRTPKKTVEIKNAASSSSEEEDSDDS